MDYHIQYRHTFCLVSFSFKCRLKHNYIKRVCYKLQSIFLSLTLIKEPTQEPGNLRLLIQQETSLTFQWDPIACGSRGGDNMIYEFSINTSPPRSGTVSSTIQTISNLDPCTTYEFKVKAVNSAGDGPEISIIAATKDTGVCVCVCVCFISK